MIPGTTPPATYPASTLPQDVTFTIRPQTEFELLMADITQARVYIIQLKLYDPVLAQDVTVYVSSHPSITEVIPEGLPDGNYIIDGAGEYIVDGGGAYIVDGS